jgi:hypothetical protein
MKVIGCVEAFPHTDWTDARRSRVRVERDLRLSRRSTPAMWILVAVQRADADLRQDVADGIVV